MYFGLINFKTAIFANKANFSAIFLQSFPTHFSSQWGILKECFTFFWLAFGKTKGDNILIEQNVLRYQVFI